MQQIIQGEIERSYYQPIDFEKYKDDAEKRRANRPKQKYLADFRREYLHKLREEEEEQEKIYGRNIIRS